MEIYTYCLHRYCRIVKQGVYKVISDQIERWLSDKCFELNVFVLVCKKELFVFFLSKQKGFFT